MKIDFYGNQQATKIIERSLESGRLSHAYLFHGPAGSGKRTLAKQFAKGILCQSKNPPCENCPSCKKTENNIHPDFVQLAGSGGRNSFHVKEVRELRSDAYIRPNDGKFKVFLLTNVEDMSASAANSLLKVLEEPPEYVIFLLTCVEPRSVPPTILSRCVSVGLFPVSFEQCCLALNRLAPDEGRSHKELAAALSGGVIGRALDLLDASGSKKALEAAFKITKGLTAGNELDIIVATGVLENNRELAQKTLVCLNEILCLALEYGHSGKQVPDISELTESMPNYQIIKIMDIIRSCLFQLEYNGNLKLLLTWMCSGIGKVLNKITELAL